MQSFSIREDGSEILRYNAPDFPVRTGYSCLSVFAGYAAACHWHRDFEALIPLDGDMDYRVNGAHVHIRRGEAILVNSRRLHYGYSEKRRECRYCYLLFPPQLVAFLPAAAAQLEALSEDGGPDYWLLSPDREEDRESLRRIRFLCDHAHPREALAVQSACAGLMDDLCRRSAPAGRGADAEWALLRTMVGYIQTHYREPVFLADIAAAGAVCRSRCCRIFREKLHVSPLQYATQYRLEKACSLMRSGSGITDAAFAVGFGGVSYFSETFRKAYGVTPSHYLKTCRMEKNGAAADRG